MAARSCSPPTSRSVWRSASHWNRGGSEMSWFRKPKQKLRAADRRDLPSDVFDKCPECGEILYRARLEQNAFVCPVCGYHNRIGAEDYIRLLLDDGEYEEIGLDLRSADPLGFVDLK